MALEPSPSSPHDTTPKTNLLFRDEALSYLSSSNDMNKIVILTRPQTWIIVLIFILMTAVLLTWSIYGRIPLTLQGQGILIPKGGVFETITAPEGTNRIQNIHVKPGDKVELDQILVTLNNPELLKNIEDRKKYLTQLQEQLAEITREAKRSIDEKHSNHEKQKESLIGGISDKNAHKAQLEEYLEKKKTLLDKGYSNRPDVLQLETQITTLRDDVRRAKEQMIQMDQDETSNKEMWEQRVRELNLKITDEERDFQNLVARSNATKTIKSTLKGRILDIQKNIGDQVSVKDPILTLSSGDENTLEAVVYFNPLEAKEIKENMKAYLIPTYLDKEHRGYIKGRIDHVSSYPETSRSLMETLQNEDLVKKFAESNPPISARIRLGNISLSDPFGLGKKSKKSTENSSSLTPGTWVYARVIVKERPPLLLVIPEIKKLLGMQQ